MEIRDSILSLVFFLNICKMMEITKEKQVVPNEILSREFLNQFKLVTDMSNFWKQLWNCSWRKYLRYIDTVIFATTFQKTRNWSHLSRKISFFQFVSKDLPAITNLRKPTSYKEIFSFNSIIYSQPFTNRNAGKSTTGFYHLRENILNKKTPRNSTSYRELYSDSVF